MFSSKGKVLFDDGHHKCLMFSSLVKGAGIQANQFLIVDGDHTAVVDPGGDLTYAPLSLEAGKYIDLKQLDYIFASHQDPDIISSVGRWVMQTGATVVCSKLWARFLPHLMPNYLQEHNGSSLEERILPVADQGTAIRLGNGIISVVPAHFLHSVGNFHFYDATSKILFSGDLGASLTEDNLEEPVTDFAAHIPAMKGFHQRYMCSRKASRLWVDMVRGMDVDLIVPQHGRYFDRQTIPAFLDWLAALECGVDLLTQADYRFPGEPAPGLGSADL